MGNIIEDNQLKTLASKALDAARNLPEERTVKRNFFSKELDKFAESVSQHIKEDLDEDVNELLEMGILLQGSRIQCRSCGNSHWFSIDDLKSTLTCPGCQKQFLTPPEPAWSFKLNSLVRNSVREHGIIPNVLALYKLEMSFRNSFIFIPCQDIYENYEQYEANNKLGDLDIICIRDGKLIIGEVKTMPDRFGPQDQERLVSLAKEIIPDKVVTASFTDKPPKIIDALKQELNPLGISVEHISLG